jgi:serine/threonine protein kinase
MHAERSSFSSVHGDAHRDKIDQNVMAFSVGARLGPYEILVLLGAGGMGEVYKARDTRLNRAVAIKTSRAQFTERFEREARAIAALNHPNICTLYDVGPDYLVMELVKGPTLSDRIAAGSEAKNIPKGSSLYFQF